MPDLPTPTPQGGEPAAAAASATPAPAAVSTRELDEFVTHLIGRHGTAAAALTRIAGEQLRYKRRAQAAEKLVVDLQKQVPAAGSVVLTGEEAKAYNDLKAKGLTLDKVPAKLAALDESEAKNKVSARKRDLKDAAGKKYDLDVLTTLLGDTPLEFVDMAQMKEDKSGVEMIKVPFVLVGTGDTKTREALDAYLERTHASFKEVWGAKDKAEGEPTDGTPTPTMPRQSTSSAPQGPKGPAAALLKVVDSQLSGFVSPGQRRKAESGTT